MFVFVWSQTSEFVNILVIPPIITCISLRNTFILWQESYNFYDKSRVGTILDYLIYYLTKHLII